LSDTTLALHVAQVLASSTNGELAPREAVRRIAMDFPGFYFPDQSLQEIRRLLQDEGDEWNKFLQRVRDARMSATYRGLLGIRDPRGQREGRWVVTAHGRDWLARVWRGPDTDYTALRLPAKRTDWRSIARSVADGSSTKEQVDHIHLDTVKPQEFEEMIAGLLKRLGWRALLTQRSYDGGIDIDASNPEPFVGGRILVQCKHRQRTIGVATVRELYGVVTAQQASKGVLVTTGRFSLEAERFARDKPIDLIDGQQLGKLLQKIASAPNA
jgi:hypothetical protein